jgi:hypothetical protein
LALQAPKKLTQAVKLRPEYWTSHPLLHKIFRQHLNSRIVLAHTFERLLSPGDGYDSGKAGVWQGLDGAF